MNAKGTTYPIWVIPLGLLLSALSIAFIPVMFFYYRKAPWVGRATRSTNVPEVVQPGPNVSPGPSSRSQRQQLNPNASSHPVSQSDSSFGIGYSDYPLIPMSSQESQSDRISSKRKSSTYRSVASVHVNIPTHGPVSEDENTEQIAVGISSLSDEPVQRNNRRLSDSTSV